ncbi:MAG: alpha/beta hydrolase [Eubacteriales bacterium]
MKEQIIFKSEAGKQEILSFYKKALKNVKFEYNEIYLDTSFGKTYLLEAGKADNPIVMLFHGSCTNSAMWYADIKTLSDAFHVFSVDILGEPGNSQPVRLGLKSNDHALWIDEIINQLKIDKVMIIGNSLGAWMAQKYAVNFPEKVEKIVLIAPSGITHAKPSYIFKMIFYAMQGEKGLKKLGKMITGLDSMPDEVLVFNKLISQHFNPIMGELPIFSDDELSNIVSPTLFMCGENDVIVDAEKSAARLEKSLENVTIHIAENNGHIIYNSMEEILPFLSGK